MRIATGILARLLFGQTATALAIDAVEVLVARSATPIERIELGRIHQVRASGWWLFWSAIEIIRNDGSAPVQLAGLPSKDGDRFVAAWVTLALAPRAIDALSEFSRLNFRERYFNHRTLHAWTQRNAELARSCREHVGTLGLAEPIRDGIHAFLEQYRTAPALVAQRNDKFVASQKVRHREWFATFGLTDEQQEAVLRDEDRCLVVAGAGTGKTRTTTAKAAFLVHSGAAKPDQVLLLAFTRKAATEISHRMQEASVALSARTFHALGLEILASSRGVKPSLSKLADDVILRDQRIRVFLDDLLADPRTRQEAVEFLVYYSVPRLSDRLVFRTVSHVNMSHGILHCRGQETQALRPHGRGPA